MTNIHLMLSRVGQSPHVRNLIQHFTIHKRSSFLTPENLHYQEKRPPSWQATPPQRLESGLLTMHQSGMVSNFWFFQSSLSLPCKKLDNLLLGAQTLCTTFQQQSLSRKLPTASNVALLWASQELHTSHKSRIQSELAIRKNPIVHPHFFLLKVLPEFSELVCMLQSNISFTSPDSFQFIWQTYDVKKNLTTC